MYPAEISEKSRVANLVKWAGGKNMLAGILMKLAPGEFGTYYEPFFGGGSLYWNLKSRDLLEDAVISDLNPDLVNLLQVIKERPDEFVSEIELYRTAYGQKRYYQIRDSFNRLKDKKNKEVERASMFLYLNRNCFNGLWRTNLKGRFNVPYGYYETFHLLSEREIYAYLLKQNGGRVPKIFLNGAEVIALDPIENMLTEKEAPKWCGPTTYKTNRRIAHQESGGIQPPGEILIEVKVGIMPSGSTIGGSGAAIYCNERLIETNSQLALYELFDSKDTRIHPGSDKAWIISVVRMSGPASLMPWTSRKDGLDSSVESYNFLKDFLYGAYENFLDEHIGKAREALRGNPDYARKKLYVSDLLVESYARKLNGGDLHVETVREAIQKSHSFIKAIERAKKVKITGPPVESNVVHLQASIEREKVDQVRKLIEAETGRETIPNTQIVRYLVDHILKCLPGILVSDTEAD